jgi:hypothetical protein
MSTIVRKRYVFDAVLAGLGGIVLWFLTPLGHVVDANDDGSDGTGHSTLLNSSESFGVVGDATEPISPGVMVPLDLEFTNPHTFPISIADLRVTVLQVSAPNADDTHPCAVGDFAVDQVSSSVEITLAAGATSTLRSFHLPAASWPHVGMVDRSVNQDGCKGASLTLDYAASGTKN